MLYFMIFHLSTPFPHLATKFITLEVTRVAERGFVTLEGLLDQEIASVIHKDDSDISIRYLHQGLVLYVENPTQIQPGILECYIKNHLWQEVLQLLLMLNLRPAAM